MRLYFLILRSALYALTISTLVAFLLFAFLHLALSYLLFSLSLLIAVILLFFLSALSIALFALADKARNHDLTVEEAVAIWRQEP